MYVGLKGFYAQLTTSSTTFFLRDVLGMDSVVVSEISSFRKLPWSMKPGFAFLSDLVTIAGYRKQRYVFMYALMGMTASICLVFLPTDILAANNARTAALCFFFINVYVAAVDILTQGKYTVLIKTVGASILTYVFVCANTAQLTTLAIIGKLNEIDPTIPLMVAMPFGVAMFYFAAMNYMGDERTEHYCGVNSEILYRHFRPFVLAMVQMACAVGLMWMTLNPWWKEDRPNGFGADFRLWYVVFFSIAIIGTSFWSLPRVLAKANAYLYLCKIMQLSAGSAMTFFYTKPKNGEPCPNTPAFDLVFFQTFTGIADKLVTLAGVFLFQKYMRKWNARPALWVTTAFTIVAGIFDIIIVERWNIDYFGISDRMMYFFGSTCIEGLVETLDELPATLLISQLCPKDVETTVYAILIAGTNLGGTISSYLATDAQVRLGVKYSQKVCDNPVHSFAGLEFTGLSWILIVGDIILPLLTIPLTFCLIPGVPLECDFSKLDDFGNIREVQMSENLNAHTAEDGAVSAEDPPSVAKLGRGYSAFVDQEEAGSLVLSSAYMRSNTRQNDAEML